MALALCALAAGVQSVRAQTVHGRVLDNARESPVSGAVVRLLNEKNDEKAHALADSLGRFAIAPPKDGTYVLEAVRLGYETTRSPLFAMHVGGDPVPVDLMMTPVPLGLKGLEVTVEQRAEELLAPMGLSPAQLGNRWIDRDFIESVQVTSDIGSAIRWKGVPGAYVINGDNAPGGQPVFCVELQRGRTSGGNRCALLVLNGAVVSQEQIALMDPDGFEAVAVLEPTEATTFYGTQGGGGAILMWTKRGRDGG